MHFLAWDAQRNEILIIIERLLFRYGLVVQTIFCEL